MRRLVLALAASLLALTGAMLPAGASVRIKDITNLAGMRDNQLVGYGIVVGLLGTGDTMRNAPFTEQAIQSMLDRMGVNVRKHPAAQPQRRGRGRDRQPAAARRPRTRRST